MKILVSVALCIVLATATHHNRQLYHKDGHRGCISKYYNKDLGPLEILLMPLGEKLWLRAWLGMHMSNLLHMEGVDLSEITQVEKQRKKRSISQVVVLDQESQNSELFLGNIVPNNYHLWLRPNVSDGRFRGDLQINVTCLQPTSNIILQADGHLKVDELHVKQLIRNPSGENNSSEDTLGKTDNVSIQVKKVTWYVKESKCVIHLQKPLAKGMQYQIHLQYIGEINRDGRGLFLRNYTTNDETSSSSWLMGTHMKNGNAKLVFPSFDEPRYKSTFVISIARPRGMKTISTSPLRFSEPLTEQSDWEWDHFLPTPPMAIGSLAVFIFNPQHFHQVSASINKEGVTVSGYAQRNYLPLAQDTVNNLARGIITLDKLLGVSFPLQQLNVVILPELPNSVQDFWGLIIFRNNFHTPSIWFHLLKQWFGHLVTAMSSNDEYISISFAQYYSQVCLSFNQCENEKASSQWMYYNFMSLYDFNEILDPNEFKQHKMVYFLRMLNQSLSENSFQKGVEIFLKYRSFSTFVEEDLWDALDIQAWSDGTLDRSMSTKIIAESWLHQDLFPLITINRNYANDSAIIEQKVFVKQWPYTVRGYEKMVWWIPVTYITSENLSKGSQESLLWLKAEKYSTLENLTNEDSFIIANYDDIGIYVVNYDPHNWRLLSEYLLVTKLENSLISASNRAALLRNAWYLAFTGELDFEIPLNMTLFIQHEKEYNVLKTLIQTYIQISWNLMGTGLEVKFDRFIANLLIHMYQETENAHIYDSRNAQVHSFLYYILCKAGYIPVIHSARLEFHKWLQDHHTIDDGIIGGVVSWIDGDWKEGLSHVMHALKDPGSFKNRHFLLTQLAASTERGNIQRLLYILFTDSLEQFSYGELKSTLRAVKNCQYVLEFLIEHWNLLKERYENKPHIWQFILEETLQKCRTADGLLLAETFYESYQRELGPSVSVVKHTLEVLKRNFDVIYKNIPHFDSALTEKLKEQGGKNFYPLI